MMVKRVAPACRLLGALVLIGAVASYGNLIAIAQDVARVPEGVVRKAAITVVKPEYPSSSKKRRTQGLAVVVVDIDEKGAVTNVEVAEAPDEDIGRSVVHAVRQWKFAPLTAEEKPIKLRGKLTFYFSIRDGKARVEDPKRFSK